MNSESRVNFHLIFPYNRKVTYPIRPDCQQRQQILSRMYSRFNQLFESAGLPKEHQCSVFKDKALRRVLLRHAIKEYYNKFLSMYRRFDLPQEFQTDVFLRKDLRNKIFAAKTVTLVQLFSRIKPGFLKDFRKRNLDPQLLADAYLVTELKEAVKTGKLNGKSVTSEAIRDFIGLT